MPELPDLQVFSTNLQRKLKGKTLNKIVVSKRAKVNAPASAFKKSLEGKKLVKVYREGKELRFAFTGQQVLGMHLMLRGKLMWAEEQTTVAHAIFDMLFTGNMRLVLSDYQYQARISLSPEESEVPDALSKQITVKFMTEQLQSGAIIKTRLLDQHVIRGIGNAYADEILWDAGISPFSISKKIPADKIKDLVKSIRSVLKDGEKQIRKKDPGIIGGELRDFLRVHNSALKKSPSGAPIQTKSNSGRKTYYTVEQQLFT